VELGKLQQDASIGVTFTWLFAVGVILITYYAGQVDLDQDCVLYGEIAYVPLDVWIGPSGTLMGPRPAWQLGFVFILNLLFVLLGYKELKITSFDAALAELSDTAGGPRRRQSRDVDCVPAL